MKNFMNDYEIVHHKSCFDGPEGPLFSSMVSCKVFSESDIVLGSIKQF